MQENLQGSLSYLEVKIKEILRKKRDFDAEKEEMIQKIIDLQNKIDLLEKKISSLQIEYEAKEQDALFTSMVVDDLLQEIGKNEEFKLINSEK